MNHKRVLRIYREEGLNLRRKRPRRRVAAAHRVDRPELFHIDQCWSMDFVADQLFNGRQIRALTVVDNLAENVLLLRLIVLQKGNRLWMLWSNYDSVTKRKPERIQVDNGREFISKALDQWAY